VRGLPGTSPGSLSGSVEGRTRPSRRFTRASRCRLSAEIQVTGPCPPIGYPLHAYDGGLSSTVLLSGANIPNALSAAPTVAATWTVCGDLQLQANVTLTTAWPGSVLVIENRDSRHQPLHPQNRVGLGADNHLLRHLRELQPLPDRHQRQPRHARFHGPDIGNLERHCALSGSCADERGQFHLCRQQSHLESHWGHLFPACERCLQGAPSTNRASERPAFSSSSITSRSAVRAT
jgi:hypothetical protein